MPEKRKHKIFLSYSRQDKPWASDFVSALREAGVKEWFDAYEITPGEDWKVEIEQALRECGTLIIILSKNSIDSRWTFFELGAAIADDKRIIPVLVEEIDRKGLPSLLMNIQLLQEESPTKAGKRVAEVLKKT